MFGLVSIIDGISIFVGYLVWFGLLGFMAFQPLSVI